MKAPGFWTPRQISAELGWSYQVLLRWCRKLDVPYLHEGNGGRGRQTMIIDQKTRDCLLYVHSLSQEEKFALGRWPETFPIVHRAAWERRPKGFKLKKEDR